MNSKYRIDSHIELYVTAEELHFLAYAATNEMQRIDRQSWHGEKRKAVARETTNHLQDLLMKLRAMAT